MSDAVPTQASPWWRHGYVWLVISGPVSVVLACIVTAVFIARSPEVMLTQEEDTHGLPVQQAPALQVRNHAATGVVPPSKEVRHANR